MMDNLIVLTSRKYAYFIYNRYGLAFVYFFHVPREFFQIIKPNNILSSKVRKLKNTQLGDNYSKINVK